MNKVILYYTQIRRTVVVTDNPHLSKKCQIVRKCNGFGVICVEGIEMHNNTQTPEDIRGYSVYAIYGIRHDGPTNSNTSIVCYDADRAYAEYLHKIKVSKLDAVVLEAWNKDAADDCILRNEPTKHALKKGVF